MDFRLDTWATTNDKGRPINHIKLARIPGYFGIERMCSTRFNVIFLDGFEVMGCTVSVTNINERKK